MKKKSPLKAITADAALVEAAFKHGQSTVPTYDPEVTKMNAKLAENLFSPTLKALKTRQTACSGIPPDSHVRTRS